MKTELRVSRELVGLAIQALECLRSELKTGSEPKHNWECDAITEGLRTAAVLQDFQAKDIRMEQVGHFPEERVS